MKRKWKNIGILFLALFSFYYTNHMTKFMEQIDPIMIQIKENEKKFSIPATNAIIKGDSVEVGKNGYEINDHKSYQRMKKYGAYNETLMVLKEVKPEVSVENHFDKYIVSGNKKDRNIGLVILVKEDTDLKKITTILEKNNTPATFFMDGTFLEKNTSFIRNHSNFEWEIRSYQEKIEPSYLKTAISYLKTIHKKDGNYCLEENTGTILKICSKMKMHTIKPALRIKKGLYKEIKTKIENGLILAVDCNPYIEEELSATLQYAKRKGYQWMNLRDFLHEKVEE